MRRTLRGDLSVTLYGRSHFPPDEVQIGRMTVGTGSLWLQFSDGVRWYRVGRSLTGYIARIWLEACITKADVLEALEATPYPEAPP